MKNYPFIRAWGKIMGSFDYYIDDQIEEAVEDKCPQNVVYKDGDIWKTIDDISNQKIKMELIELAK